MNQDYFTYNGDKYYSGTQFNLLNPSHNGIYGLAYFVYYNTDSDTVWYKMAYTSQIKGCSMENFLKSFCGATGKIDPSIHPPIEKQLKDSQIPKLVIGWMWYIFLMAIVTIFYGAIVWWALISIVFFNWRKGVIEKEGYYIER